VVHNGINTSDVFVPRDASDLVRQHHLEGRYVVLSVAPDLMSPRKGGGWVLEVAKRLADRPITFIMIGVKEKSINCTPNVIYLPPMRDQKALAKYYSLANIFLLTSQSETFSLTCAESLACGTPVIGFDSGGPIEVAPEPFGHFVPYGKIDDLVSLITESHCGSLNIAQRDDCTKYANMNFSNDRMCEDYIGIYREMNSLRDQA
jgi:glycosyltransferase involved in cell wall biosynthesis